MKLFVQQENATASPRVPCQLLAITDCFSLSYPKQKDKGEDHSTGYDSLLQRPSVTQAHGNCQCPENNNGNDSFTNNYDSINELSTIK